MVSTRLPDLKPEYDRLWNTCTIRPDWQPRIKAVADRAVKWRSRYEAVETEIGVPWWFVAALHNLEADGDFGGNLHNGQRLTQRTTIEPIGRGPFKTWEDSAIDALTLKEFDRPRVKDRSLAAWLWRAELFNGFGYRLYRPTVLTPYLWSGSNHYQTGKYVADGQFDPKATSAQVGAAVLWKTLAAIGAIELPDRALSDAPKH